VGEFSADWLALREPADHAARSLELTRAVAGALSASSPIRVLDLGSGSGSNFRYLAPHLPARQQWLLVDRNRALLSHAGRAGSAAETLAADLAVLDQTLFTARALVTASALLDLVSERWLTALAALCREANASVLFALTYDGRIQCWPREVEDCTIRDLVNEHQRTDKGFGPALGPDATDRAASCFSAAGYVVRRAGSDWTLGSDARGLQHALIDGWARAAETVAPAQSPIIRAWRARRRAHVESGRSRLLVGHQDLAGVLGAFS
jgi:hypothetical protein